MRTNKEYSADLLNPDMPDIPYNTLNLGPTHPATHGIFQNVLKMDGERIVSAEQTVGYIHRAFEKIAERRPLYQITPLTITTPSLPDVQLGASYSTILTASGGLLPYVWSISSGALPPMR